MEKTKGTTQIMVDNASNKGITLHVVTHLMNKEEVFKMLALAHAANLPLLLIGEPGVAKTNAVTDYASAEFDRNTKEGEDEYEKAVYILETDEGTKSSEVKGRLNLREFIQNGDWSLITPIAAAKYVVINEVDKASAGLRNSLLGVMNEKILFNGEAKIPCDWKLMVATCNEIPKDELGSPFWDRFILKMKVERMPMNLVEKYYNNGDKKFTQKMELYIPTSEEIEKVVISPIKLKKFLDVAYKDLSDRTLTFVPKLVKIVSLVYNCRIDSALVKVASIMIGPTAATTLSKNLISAEMKAIYDKMDLLQGMKDQEHFEATVAEINLLVNNFLKSGRLHETDIEEIKQVLSEIEEKSGFGIELVD